MWKQLLRYLLERLFRAALTIWLVVTLVFFGIRLSGDPAQMMLGDSATPETIDAYKEAMGLNDSLLVQYRRYLSSLVHGDFGKSLVDPRPVTEVFGSRLPQTLQLMTISLLLALAIGIPIGVLVAMKRDSAFDRAVISFCLLGQSMPGFLIAILMIFTFSVGLRWLPSSGHGGWKHLVMPVATLTWGALATIARLTRSSVLESLRQDYARTARAKGLGESRVMTLHVLRNAAIPLATMVGFLVSGAIAGSVVVETVFAWPGMGRLVAGSVDRRDYPVLQFAVLIITGTVVTVNFLVDIAYGVLDPRIRTQGNH